MTDQFSKDELNEALRAVTSMIQKCEKALLKLTRGTSQWTLLDRRIKALHISSMLISKELQEYSDID